jgi:biopolymer transport protein ExbD
MAFGGGNRKGVKNEINVTPLVDVVLVLLIIFMVITPMLQRGKDVHLPKAQKSDEENKKADPLVLSITSDKKLYLESDEVSEETLEASVQAKLAQEPGRKILVKGDERLTVADVRTVLQRAQRAGARGVALAVEELKQ